MSVNVPGVAWVPPAPSYLGDAASPQASPRPGVVVLPAKLTGGFLVASWRPGPAVELHRITVSADNNCQCSVYVGDRSRANLVSATYNGAFDENECVQPILVPEGTTLFVEWKTAAGTASTRVEYVQLGG